MSNTIDRARLSEKLRIEERATEALKRRRANAQGADRAAIDRVLEASARYTSKLRKLLDGRPRGVGAR